VKRDRRLRGLSSEHHHALTLARTIATLLREERQVDAARDLVRRFDEELEPHFRIEEEVLLPALRRKGEVALVERTEEDHGFLRAVASSARQRQLDGLAAFAQRLTDHVRFEERELFPRCEERLESAVLDEVARRVARAATSTG
jgi:hemerythrin-like domain-containing protein